MSAWISLCIQLDVRPRFQGSKRKEEEAGGRTQLARSKALSLRPLLTRSGITIGSQRTPARNALRPTDFASFAPLFKSSRVVLVIHCAFFRSCDTRYTHADIYHISPSRPVCLFCRVMPTYIAAYFEPVNMFSRAHLLTLFPPPSPEMYEAHFFSGCRNSPGFLLSGLRQGGEKIQAKLFPSPRCWLLAAARPGPASWLPADLMAAAGYRS